MGATAEAIPQQLSPSQCELDEGDRPSIGVRMPPVFSPPRSATTEYSSAAAQERREKFTGPVATTCCDALLWKICCGRSVGSAVRICCDAADSYRDVVQPPLMANSSFPARRVDGDLRRRVMLLSGWLREERALAESRREERALLAEASGLLSRLLARRGDAFGLLPSWVPLAPLLATLLQLSSRSTKRARKAALCGWLPLPGMAVLYPRAAARIAVLRSTRCQNGCAVSKHEVAKMRNVLCRPAVE